VDNDVPVIRFKQDTALAEGTYSVDLPSERAIQAGREQFATSHHLRLEGFLDAHLMRRITGEIDSARFYERSHGEMGVESCMDTNPLLGFMLFLMHDPRLLGTLESITGLDGLRSFVGRVFRMDPQENHYDAWHNDLAHGRLLALSVNLGREPYSGGSLQLRRYGQEEADQEVPNTVPGDAVLFRIDPALEHRVLPVTGSVPRTALAGWFTSDPVFLNR
jgi:hypothetical protein